MKAREHEALPITSPDGGGTYLPVPEHRRTGAASQVVRPQADFPDGPGACCNLVPPRFKPRWNRLKWRFIPSKVSDRRLG